MDLEDALASLTARQGFRRTKHRPELGHDEPVVSGTLIGDQDPGGPLGVQGALENALAPRHPGAPEDIDEDSELIKAILLQRFMGDRSTQQSMSLSHILKDVKSNFDLGSPDGLYAFDNFNPTESSLSPIPLTTGGLGSPLGGA